MTNINKSNQKTVTTENIGMEHKLMMMDPETLKENIFDGHFKYLETDKCERKLELRKQLENLIRLLLNVVPHKEKFFFPDTYKILESSIKVVTPENGKNPAFGFESISIYASNLYLHPWRKEYRTIRIYCGYYQHEVAANLVEPELLFHCMGYSQIHNEILQFSNNICPENLRNVSRDALTAYVECQIIKDIHYELNTKGLPLSYEKIYNYRKNNILTAADILLAYESGLRDDKMQFKPPDYANLSFGNNMPNYTQSMIPSSSAHYNGYQHQASQYQPSYSNKCDYNTTNEMLDYHSVPTNGYLMGPLPPKPQSQSIRNDINAYNVSGTRAALPYRISYELPELSGKEPQAMTSHYMAMPPQPPLHHQYLQPYYNPMVPQLPPPPHQMHASQLYAYLQNQHPPYVYTTSQHGTNLLETHFTSDYNALPAQFDDMNLPKSYNYPSSKNHYNISNYNTHHKQLNNHHDLDYDNSTVTDKTISSRNSDFDSYDEQHSNLKSIKKPINKKDHEGVGSADKWNHLYKDYKQNQDYNHKHDDRSLEALSLDPTPTPIVSSKKLSMSSQSRSNSNNKNNEYNNNNIIVNSNNSKLLNGGTKIKKSSAAVAAALPQEWNCVHCTFLNSNAVRICKICSRSRDMKESLTVDVK